jgi:FAD/FMN-containing dehydrogenase
VCRHTGLPAPLQERSEVYLLVECAGRRDPGPELLHCLESLPEARDAVVAMDTKDRARLWTYRESHPEAVGALGVPIKLDVSVPIAGVADFERRLRKLCAGLFPGLQLVVFGHLAEGNLHVNLVGGAGPDAEAVVAEVLQLVADCDGSIGAEHGIGQAKSPWMALSRSPAELAVMRRIKRSLDPQGMLNPGILFPANPSLGPSHALD